MDSPRSYQSGRNEESKECMRLEQTSQMLGDATCWLQAVDIPDGLTLEGAVDWIVGLNRRESGIIRATRAHKTYDIANYSDGEITEIDDGLMEEFGHLEVRRIRANGGWGQMNYYVDFKR